MNIDFRPLLWFYAALGAIGAAIFGGMVYVLVRVFQDHWR